jgi:hypothetical protein
MDVTESQDAVREFTPEGGRIGSTAILSERTVCKPVKKLRQNPIRSRKACTSIVMALKWLTRKRSMITGISRSGSMVMPSVGRGDRHDAPAGLGE